MTAPLTEVERKRSLTSSDRDHLVERLGKRGYRHRATHTETDTYYSRRDVDFMETVECLRVRERDGFAEITYKPGSTSGNTVDGVISKVETNARLAGAGEAESANQLLVMLGMKRLATVQKHRVEYASHTEGTVAIDTVNGVGSFVEVEVMSADPEAANTLLATIEEELAITDLAVVDLPYRDLVMRAGGTA